MWQNNPPISLNHTQGANSPNNKKQHYFLLFHIKRLETQQPTDTNKHRIIYIRRYTLPLIFSPSYLPSMLLFYHHLLSLFLNSDIIVLDWGIIRAWGLEGPNRWKRDQAPAFWTHLKEMRGMIVDWEPVAKLNCGKIFKNFEALL